MYLNSDISIVYKKKNPKQTGIVCEIIVIDWLTNWLMDWLIECREGFNFKSTSILKNITSYEWIQDLVKFGISCKLKFQMMHIRAEQIV